MLEPGTLVQSSEDGPAHVLTKPGQVACSEEGPFDLSSIEAKPCELCDEVLFMPIPRIPDEDLTLLAKSVIDEETMVRFNAESDVAGLLHYFGYCFDTTGKENVRFANSLAGGRVGAAFQKMSELKQVSFENGETQELFLSCQVIGIEDANELLGKIQRLQTLVAGVPGLVTPLDTDGSHR